MVTYLFASAVGLIAIGGCMLIFFAVLLVVAICDPLRHKKCRKSRDRHRGRRIEWNEEKKDWKA